MLQVTELTGLPHTAGRGRRCSDPAQLGPLHAGTRGENSSGRSTSVQSSLRPLSDPLSDPLRPPNSPPPPPLPPKSPNRPDLNVLLTLSHVHSSPLFRVGFILHSVRFALHRHKGQVLKALKIAVTRKF